MYCLNSFSRKGASDSSLVTIDPGIKSWVEQGKDIRFNEFNKFIEDYRTNLLNLLNYFHGLWQIDIMLSVLPLMLQCIQYNFQVLVISQKISIGSIYKQGPDIVLLDVIGIGFLYVE